MNEVDRMVHENYEMSNKFSLDNIKETFYIIINGIFILLSIDFISNYIPTLIRKKYETAYHINMGTIIVTGIILLSAFAIVKYIGKNSFNSSMKKSSKVQNFLFGACFAAFSLCLGFISYFLRSCTLFSLNAYIVFITLSLYWIYILVKALIAKYQKRKCS